MKLKLESILIFFIGFFSCATVFSFIFFSNGEIPFSLNGNVALSPSNWLNKENIMVYNDKIVIYVDNASLSSYQPTGSMRPLLDSGANGIRIKPKSVQEINNGDIISFRKNGMLIVHRVVDKGVDSEGIYFITKGDNNNYSDGKVRFEDIEYITIGILY
ncbi:MAG: hypothetical protein PHX15_00225 [Candidatus Nanoarchaeia archaeon]|jgi:signal peptidase I|nr:hypothetical protein [Candidatus Nanoarchaeia archaeon]